MGDGDEFDAAVDGGAQCVNGDLTVFVVGDDVDPGAGLARHLEEGDVIAGVLRHCRQDAVSWLERHGVKGHIPSAGGVLDDSDFIALAAQQRGRRIIDMFHRLTRLSCRLVATDLRLQAQMVDRGVQHRLWHQRCPGIVEM